MIWTLRNCFTSFSVHSTYPFTDTRQAGLKGRQALSLFCAYAFMPVNEYWEWTRNELEVLSRANLIRKPALVDEFEPGDFAYIEDSLATVFMEFLKRKEYRLTPNEDVLTPTKGRYCVVLQRLSLDKYIVCCCATYGGARGFQDLSDPVARHFGVPLNENTIWPGLAPLRTRPPWKSANGAFVLAIPAIRDGLTTSNLRERVRLGFQDLHRLKNIIKDRSQSFDRHAEQIRAAYIASQMDAKRRRGQKVVRPPLIIDGEVAPNVLADMQLEERRFSTFPMRLTLPDDQQNLAWLLGRIHRRAFDRSIYLNNQSPSKRPFLFNLPKPFFAPTLRTSLATIKHLLFVR